VTDRPVIEWLVYGTYGIAPTIKYEYNEDETFDFVSENEEADHDVSVMLFEDIDYPLPDEYLAEISLCAMKFPNSMELLLDANV
jgi:hypothetical protein